MGEYVERDLVLDRDIRYRDLEKRKARIVIQVNEWMAEATSLHTDSPEVGEKADVIASRDDFVAQLRTALGI